MADRICATCGEDQQPPRRLKRGMCSRCYYQWWAKQDRDSSLIKHPGRPVIDRLYNQSAPQPNGCLHWTGYVNAYGYGRIYVESRSTLVHRAMFEAAIGPIPEGLVLDHACHNGDEECAGGRTCMHRRCINPEHLEAVTHKENIERSHHSPAARGARLTHCSKGHELTPENRNPKQTGSNRCRACVRDKRAKARSRSGERSVPLPDSCGNGHLLTPENLILDGKWFRCRACNREYAKAYRARQRSA